MIFSESLKKNDDFRKVYKAGRSKADRFFVLYAMRNHTETNRLGISVSKKVGNSVIRHHLTRLIREAYRLNEEMFHSGWDIVVVVRQSGADADFFRIRDSLLYLANLQKLINKAENNE